MEYSITERNRIYKIILIEFDKVQESHKNKRLSFGLCAYFLTKQLHIDDFPEITKHKPTDHNTSKYGGYWFLPEGLLAIELRRNILVAAIEEAENKTNMIYEKLTKENFWDDLYKDYPKAMKKFCAWIDEYKKRINWDSLFPVVDRPNDWSAIKYHHLPIAMQIGIFMQYVVESDCIGSFEVNLWEKMKSWEKVPQLIEKFFDWENDNL